MQQTTWHCGWLFVVLRGFRVFWIGGRLQNGDDNPSLRCELNQK
jgi:hypothetical protein